MCRMTTFTGFFVVVVVFFFEVLVANVEFASFAPKKRMNRFHGNGPYCKFLTEKEPIRARGFA